LSLLVKLQTELSINDLKAIRESTNLIFDNTINYHSKECWIMHKHSIVSDDRMRFILELLDGIKFFKIESSMMVPPDVVDYFKGTGVIPIHLDIIRSEVYIAVYPGFTGKIPQHNIYTTSVKVVVLYDYIDMYYKHYLEYPPFMHKLPILDSLNIIISEALTLHAMDTTISSRENKIVVYHNVNKRDVYSNRVIDSSDMPDLIRYIMAKSNVPQADNFSVPIYAHIDIDKQTRGRIVMSKTYWGVTIDIRILPKALLKDTYAKLNIPKDVQTFLVNNFINYRPGLKLLMGPTGSGKNTTAIVTLFELYKRLVCKIIAIENPTEIVTTFMEHNSTDSEEDFARTVESVIRRNPALVYVVEMTDKTALPTIKIANVSKPVISTIHANSPAEVPFRIMDLTGWSLDRVILCLDCIVDQKLVPRICPKCGDVGCPDCHKSGMLPVFRYIQITPELRREIIGKPISDVYNIIDKNTIGNDALKKLLDNGLISQKTFDWR